MSARDQIVLFAEMIFTVFLIYVSVTFFMVGDRLLIFGKILADLAPVVAMGAILFIKTRLNKYMKRRMELRTGRKFDEINLNLSYYHRTMSDFFLFILPMTVLLIAIWSKLDVATDDIVQAAAVFLIFYFWQYIIFKHRSD